MRQRFIGALASAGCVAILLITASSAAAANTLGPPPWTGALCPAIGLDTGCQYGIDVTAVGPSGVASKQTIAQDGDQPAYDGVEDATLVVKNDGSAPLKSLHMGIPNSGQQLFAFEGDGLCAGSANGTVTWTPPAGCPFNASPTPATYNPTGYEGPGTYFSAIDPNADSGKVNFNPALAPGQTTYLSLETNPNVVPTAGSDNNWPTSAITAPGKAPSSYVAVPAGTNVTDQVTINGQFGAVNGAVLGDGSASGTVTYKLFANDNSCSTAPVYTSAPKTVSAGIAAPSDPVGAGLAAGRYYWREDYSGDTKNTSSQTICGAEILAIGSTLITTNLSSTTVLPSTPVTDTAHIGPIVPNTLLTGTVNFAIYTDSACKVPYTATPFTAITPTGSTVTSPPVSLPSGIYFFVASYSGDSKNGAGASTCGSEVLHVANSASTILKRPKVGNGYKITFTVAVTDPGKFSWAFTTSNKKGLFKSVDLAVTASGKKCGKGKIKVKGHCVPATVKYGSGSKTISAGIVTITVRPSGKVKKVLNAGHKLKLSGLLKFQSAFGGTPTSQTVNVTVHGKKVHGKKPCTAKQRKKHLCK